MDGAIPWSADVETFTSLIAPSQTRLAPTPSADWWPSRRRLITFLDLLRGMEACLVTTEDSRARVLLLAETVAGYVAPRVATSPPARRLLRVLLFKLDDFAVIRAALICATLLRADAAHDDGVVTPAVDRAGAATSPTVSSTPSTSRLVQADRQRSRALLALLNHPSASDPEGHP